ncbi:MAG: hypothetical protein H6925_04290 [Holosporaceae bacterium]|nr:MAG: hypothetical protein H6925_04290 [Holosporaceae bacterium]
MLTCPALFRLIKEPEETQHKMGRATQYYLRIFHDFYKSNRWFSSWNWSSFLAALFGAEMVWLIYRRMYLYALVYFLIILGITYTGLGLFYMANKMLSPDIRAFIVTKFADKDFLFMTVKIVLWMVKLPLIVSFGVWGNALYFRFLEKEARKASTPKSGVSSVAAGAFLLVCLSAILLNNYLLQTSATNLYTKAYELFV